MKHSILSLLVGLAFIGCTSEEVPQQGDCNQEIAKEAVLTVINNPQQIGANELAEYAGKVISNSGVQSRAQSASTVTEVYSDKNGSGIYAVNFGENDGFVLLTTQQKMHPVVAMSETGHFDVSKIEGSPIELWLKGVEMAISHPEDIPDSVVMAAKLEWNKLNSTEVSLSAQSRSIDENIYNTINLAIDQWRKEGYSVTRVSDATADNYPPSIRDAINKIKEYHAVVPNPAEISFILTKTTQSGVFYFPEIKTKWHQEYPYNYILLNDLYPTKKLGCVPIAVAQILNFHKSPQYIDFSQFPNEAFGANEYLTQFLMSVGETCGIDYNSGKSSSNLDGAKAAFSRYGYSFNVINKFDRTRIHNSLRNKYPVYLQGDVVGDTVGHAWVCDGSRGGNNDTHYIVKNYTGDFADIDPTAAFGTVASETVSAAITPSLHMVWGWNIGDGWYMGTDWTINRGYDQVRIYNDFRMLVDIKPL